MRILLALFFFVSAMAGDSFSRSGGADSSGKVLSKVPTAVIGSVGFDYITVNERKIFITSDTTIVNTRGTAISIASLTGGMKIELVYYFSDDNFPVAKSIKVISGF